MIVLFTDFGLAGPYTGQVKTVLHLAAPAVPVIDLFADAPSRNPRAAAYLLAAYAEWFPPRTVFLAVIDPGVGGARAPLIAAADDRWFVGPENGLFEIVMRRAVRTPRLWDITWRPALLSASFHGRDLFAPVAARLALGETPPGKLRDPAGLERNDWPDDLAEIVYVDHYGNAMTGLRAGTIPAAARLRAGGREVPPARTFSAVPPGAAFWYENSTGLAEIAVNGGRADAALGLAIGSAVEILA
ncbi:MAG TPA: SAM-dependent chlorinase/fluorinase [Stellaceae bacterium]|nr:SAM-dependent chlorinase/fluorinase [Stellaceae bacterium]